MHVPLSAALLGPFVLSLTNYCMEQVGLSQDSTMAHKNPTNDQTVVVKLKLNVIAFKPKIQQTEMTSVYETRVIK